MPNIHLTAEHLKSYASHLTRNEKAPGTVEKYLRDAGAFFQYARNKTITKELTVAYKEKLLKENYAVRTVNTMLASLNSLLEYLGLDDCKVKNIRTQRRTYCSEEKELTKAEYMRLLESAKANEKLYLILQTICGTGIRVSELQYFTVEAVLQGNISVRCKGKIRTILLPAKLKKSLLAYAKQRNITSGAIFLGSNGKPMHRGSVWAQMKRLCKSANVNPAKVFPHNLRKLFARTFYAIEKDIAKLADILGHSSIETTRIYIMTTGTEHRRQLEQLGLVV